MMEDALSQRQSRLDRDHCVPIPPCLGHGNRGYYPPQIAPAGKVAKVVRLRMKAQKHPSLKEKSPSAQIDAIISKSGDWRGKTLSQLRTLIKQADAAVVEEVKWKKPSRPEGVPVWSHEGILCVADTLKNAVRLTFPKGAQLKDPKKLFNARLDSRTVRAIDLHEGDMVDDAALKALILAAVGVNTAKSAIE